MNQENDMSQSIFFRDIELLCKIGVYEHERRNPQRVIINLKLILSNELSPKNDKIDETLNYDIVYRKIKDITSSQHFNLVETLANQIFKYLKSLKSLPTKLHKLINDFTPVAKKISKKIALADACYFIGRNIGYPIALEGSLKLKEISYMHSEGFAGGEMKHGPIALIDKGTITICIIPNNELYEKSLSNTQEISARNGRVVILSSLKLKKNSRALDIPQLPKENFIDSPFIYTIPLQLISYYFALSEGTDIDQPRNLAKSVTVE